jgi:hypothetical protein
MVAHSCIEQQGHLKVGEDVTLPHAKACTSALIPPLALLANCILQC